MASWFDIIALCFTVVVFIGAILGFRFIATQISSVVNATKESLKSQGLTIDDKGISVRTTSRYSREDYVDATQRGFIRAMGASVFGPAEPIPVSGSESSTAASKPPPLSRHGSSTSSLTNDSADTPEEKEKKRRHFSLRRGARS
ncbi:hypothetical protein EW145_g1976 [Phellinidium pouzarii]|uniref:Uncharacterized protein n=1 Tax=Phellinidium pouzarii TaxID=167371 RepID=A0A4S4LCK8_9AGAM|nr:hypothetical protein EW145_g1976 [Phellinidium pouzarii]